MIDPQQLSDREILAHIDEASFKRGQAYARQGRIISPRRQDNTLKALCSGSIPEPYRLQATLDKDGRIVAAECSCPVGYGGHCKHVAALLLTWRAEPERFVEVQDLATALEGKSKDELVRLLLTVASVNPAIEQMLEITAAGTGVASPSPSAEFYQDQVATMLGYATQPWESWEAFGVAGQFGSLLAQGRALAEQGDWHGAAEVYRGLLNGVLESDAFTYDEDGGLADVAQGCIEGLGRCLEEIEDRAAREKIVGTLFEFLSFDINEYGGIGISDQIPDILVYRTTPEERAALAEELRGIVEVDDEWSSRTYSNLLIEFETELLEDEEYLERTRELGLTDRLVNRLLELERTEEALQEAADAEPSEFGVLARTFERHGQGDLFEPLVERRLAAGTIPRYYGYAAARNLHDWLKDRYIQRGDFAAALPIAEQEFKEYPTFERYREVRELAQETGRWAELRPDLMAWMGGRAPELRIQIHLDEGDLDEALRNLRGLDLTSPFSGPRHGLRRQVAEAVEEKRPEAALEIYLKIVDELIDERGRDNYATAAALLVRARDVFDRQGRYEQWEEHIARLRSEHTRLPALQEELDRAGV